MTVAAPGDTFAPYLGGQLTALRHRISTSNHPGDLDGLFARYILGDRAGIPWEVDPITEGWLAENADHLDDAGPLAAVGYGLTPPNAVGPDMIPKVRAALVRFMQRDHLRGGPTFLHDPRILLGIALAVLAVRAEMPDAPAWLARTLADSRLKPANRVHELAQAHVLVMITGQAGEVVRLDPVMNAADLALVYWMVSQNTARLADPTERRVLSDRLMRAVMQSDAAELTVTQAALLASAADSITSMSIDQVLLSRAHLSLVLNRFPAAMRRWRWDTGDRVKEPICWPITSEREVQDILWLVLRSVFDDVIDEDTNPKIGHASTQADFGIPSLGLFVEAKYVYKGTTAEFKKIEHEIMVDSVAYLQRATLYDQIVVFIYDASASVEHHDLTRRTLMEVPGVADVIIVSRPGVLAASSAPSISKPRAKKTNIQATQGAPTRTQPAKKIAPRAKAAANVTTSEATVE